LAITNEAHFLSTQTCIVMGTEGGVRRVGFSCGPSCSGGIMTAI